MSAAQEQLQGFLDDDTATLSRAFLEQGYVIRPVDDQVALGRLRDAMAAIAAEHLDQPAPKSAGSFMNGIHGQVDAAGLNALRLRVINGVNDLPWAREAYYSLARSGLERLVGNELAMQRRLNLSIQMPGDDSSLLAVHADVWDGDSPFEVVVWLPLVDCHGSKSMFILPPEAQREHEARWRDFNGKSTDDLFAAIEPDVEWLDVPYGSVLLFSQNLMHGNRINREYETRWSMNCRFKSLFSPYAQKRLGEFFEPITIRAATRLGMSYQMPESFNE